MRAEAEAEIIAQLGRMTPPQAARWGLLTLADTFAWLRAKYRWNPVAYGLISLLQARSTATLSDTGLGSSDLRLVKRTLKKIEKTRRLADTLWSFNYFGQAFLLGIQVVHSFFAEFQCGYEQLRDGTLSSGESNKSFENLANVLTKQAGLTTQGVEQRFAVALSNAKRALAD